MVLGDPRERLDSPATKSTPSPAAAEAPSPPSSSADASAATEGEEKKIAYTEAELEVMIERKVADQVEKALLAKMAEIMKMNDGSKKKAEEKSREDLEVEAAMERMRADEAKERAAKQ